MKCEKTVQFIHLAQDSFYTMQIYMYRRTKGLRKTPGKSLFNVLHFILI